jgi:hypothetical protein
MKPKLSDIVKVLRQKANTSDTLFVSDPKDKRLKSYQDSLSLYNKSKKEIGKDGNSKKNTPVYIKKGINPRELMKTAYSFVQNQLIDVSGRYDNNMNPNNNFPAPKVKQKILPIAGIGINEGNSMGGWYDIYKKPTQPVKYKKSDVIKALEDKQGSDTLYVDDLKSPRLKAYQDSLKLYGFNPSRKTLSKVIKEGVYNKANPKSVSGDIKPIEYYKANMGNINKLDAEGKTYTFFQPDVTKENSSRFYYDQNKFTRDRKTGEIAISNVGIYKKPVQPVKYKKPETKKEEPAKKNESKPVEKKKNVYEGTPVYSPGAGSGMPSALVGFRSKSGDTTYIKPEDYERFAVPKYGKAFIESKSKKK